MFEYPRVLIVYMSCLTQTDQHGLSIRSWFADWPAGQLAQIYSGADWGGEKFCGQTFRLGSDERRWGSLFIRLKHSSLGESSRPIRPCVEDNQTLWRRSRAELLRNKVALALIRSGLWEVLFPPRLSNRLMTWVEAFQPEVIYCQGYSLSFAWLPVMLSKRFHKPICFQAGDDWPTYLYRNSILAWAIRPMVKRAVDDLITRSSVRLANGVRMAEEYSARFGHRFAPLMIGDRIDRFRLARPIRLFGPDTLSIIYSGNLGQGRWQSLADVCMAAKALKSAGYRIMVTAFVSTIPPDAVNILKGQDNLHILPSPTHDLLPAYLKGADILLLPEVFDATLASEIRLSISTKAHLYMMSGKPILVYGSPLTGVVDYARRAGWAIIVDRRDPQNLMVALRQLIDDDKLRTTLVKRGTQVAITNHDELAIRQRFKAALQGMLGPSSHGDDSVLSSPRG